LAFYYLCILKFEILHSVNQEIRDKYEVVIGLEVHAQLQTESKIFAADAASFGASPNTHISPITLGHPGTLPKLNKRAVEFAMRMGIACNSQITENQYFDRKIISIRIFQKAIRLLKIKLLSVWVVAFM